MKRFWLFCYEDYDACGGMGDFQGDYETFEEATLAAPTRCDNQEIWEVTESGPKLHARWTRVQGDYRKEPHLFGWKVSPVLIGYGEGASDCRFVCGEFTREEAREVPPGFVGYVCTKCGQNYIGKHYPKRTLASVPA